MKGASMKTRLFPLLLFVIACNGAESPTAPEPMGPRSAVVGSLYDETTRSCLADAQVEIIAGRAAGTVAKQNQQNCGDIWGFALGDWVAGEKFRLRATASGYEPKELDWVTTPGPGANNIEIFLKRVQ